VGDGIIDSDEKSSQHKVGLWYNSVVRVLYLECAGLEFNPQHHKKEEFGEFACLFVSVVLGMKLRTLYILGKHSTTELTFQAH
jgi:hypothetical protein